MWQTTKVYRHLTIALSLGIFLLVPTARRIQHYFGVLVAECSLIIKGLVAVGIVAAMAYVVFKYIKNVRPLIPIRSIIGFASLILLILYATTFFLFNFSEFLHLPIYGTLSLLVINSINSKGRYSSLLATLIFTNTISIIDECLQWLHPSRFFDIRDLAINLVGIAIGIVIAWPFIQRKTNIQ